MTIEQYSALVDLMPQIEKTLEKKGQQVPRPQYESTASAAPAADQEERDQGEPEAEEEEEDVKPETKYGKRNIEATSDEEEDD